MPSPTAAVRTVKITGLTWLNVRALRETMGDYISAGVLTVTATTATFEQPTWGPTAADIVRGVKAVRCAGMGNRHPAGSLSAVIRKLDRAS